MALPGMRLKIALQMPHVPFNRSSLEDKFTSYLVISYFSVEQKANSIPGSLAQLFFSWYNVKRNSCFL